MGFVQAGVDACAANVAPHEVAPQRRICDLQEGFLVGNIEESELVEGGQVSAAWMDYLSLKGYEESRGGVKRGPVVVLLLFGLS